MKPSLSTAIPGGVRILVFGHRPGDGYRAGRTLRALRAMGLAGEDVSRLSAAALAERIGTGGPVWLMRAGGWPASCEAVPFPPPSGTGRPLAAVGVVRPEPGARPTTGGDADQWALLLTATGGDFSPGPDGAVRLPLVASLYLDAELARRLAASLSRGETLSAALPSVLGGDGLRVVRYAPLDVHDDLALRVVQVVTSLQQGGAERIALSLVQGWTKGEVRSLLVTLGRPQRRSLPVPPTAVDLARLGGNRSRRCDALGQIAERFAADIVHGHLLDAVDVAQFATLGLPVVVTVHNMRPGWPNGLECLRAEDATLLIACAQAVEADLRAAQVPIPMRTIWNGIDFAPLQRTPALIAAGQAVRRQLGLGPDDFVLFALANPRPQKRLDLLPGVLAATRQDFRQRGIAREARLMIGGESAPQHPAAVQAEAAVRAEASRLGLDDSVRFLGSVSDVAPVLAAADVLVSCSAFEGLSLAHLEALAAGLPVVATDAGGTAEVAYDNPVVTVLPLDATPERFAEVLAGIAQAPPPEGRCRGAVHFSQARMLERHQHLYVRAIAGARRDRGDGLLLVANNFSTGGAQSSGRRLLLGLAAEGVRVRAAVLEEEAAHPTPGRRALAAAGIDVLVPPRAGTVDPSRAVALLLERLDADPPQTVLFWNVITEYKVLLADALLDVPIFDVSPGEMYFDSLERYLERPRPGLPYRSGTDYGGRLAGVIVKYQAEADQAARTLGAPVHVIPNGVPLPADPRTRRWSEGPVVIGTLARLSPQKKLEQLLTALRQAADRLPPHILRIAGGVERGATAYAEELRRLAGGLSVEWVGEQEDVGPFLRGLDFFALVAEPAGCPNASLEAMAHGLAVVATNVGGMAEQVEDGITGRLVPPGDVQALTEALIELAADPNQRAKWGAAGRARVEAYFNQRRMVADYRRVCLEPSGCRRK